MWRNHQERGLLMIHLRDRMSGEGNIERERERRNSWRRERAVFQFVCPVDAQRLSPVLGPLFLLVLNY